MSDVHATKSDGDPQGTATIVVAIVGMIVALALVIFTVVLFQNAQLMEDERKVYAAKPRELADLQFQQLARINERRWVDQQQGTVAIPIDDAIRLLVAQMKNGSQPTTMPSRGDDRAGQQHVGTRQ